MRKIFIILCVIVLWGTSKAMPVDSLWSKANQHYIDGQFAEASTLYEQILATGQESADVYFNLGNAYIKQNLIGPARLNYERALRLDSENIDIQHNLQFAKSMQLDKIDELQETFLASWYNGVVNTFSSDGWAGLFIGLFALIMLLGLVYFFTGSYALRKFSFLGGCFLIFLLLLSFAFGGKQRAKRIDNSHGIIFTPVVTAKSSPDASGSDLFIVHEGLKVRVIDEQGAWRRIILSDGKSQGWIPKESMVII